MTLPTPKIYADFHNADEEGRLRLTCIGSMEDLAEQQVVLSEGLHLTLYADDVDCTGNLDELLADGVVAYSKKEHRWVAVIDWAAIRHASDDQRNPANGTQPTPAPATESSQTKAEK